MTKRAQPAPKARKRIPTTVGGELDLAVAALLASAPSPGARRDHQAGLRLLHREGIESFAALTEALPRLRGLARWIAVRLLEGRGRHAASALVPLLAAADQSVAAEASRALAHVGSALARRGCIRLLRSSASKSGEIRRDLCSRVHARRRRGRDDCRPGSRSRRGPGDSWTGCGGSRLLRSA